MADPDPPSPVHVVVHDLVGDRLAPRRSRSEVRLATAPVVSLEAVTVVAPEGDAAETTEASQA